MEPSGGAKAMNVLFSEDIQRKEDQVLLKCVTL